MVVIILQVWLNIAAENHIPCPIAFLLSSFYCYIYGLAFMGKRVYKKDNYGWNMEDECG